MLQADRIPILSRLLEVPNLYNPISNNHYLISIKNNNNHNNHRSINNSLELNTHRSAEAKSISTLGQNWRWVIGVSPETNTDVSSMGDLPSPSAGRINVYNNETLPFMSSLPTRILPLF